PSTAAGAEPSVTADTTETESVAATPEATETPTPTPEPTLEVQTVSGENLHSAHAILIRAEDGAVMMEKAASEQTYPASITKVMTAILAIEQLADLEEQVTVPEDIFEELTAQGASVAEELANETVAAVPDYQSHYEPLADVFFIPESDERIYFLGLRDYWSEQLNRVETLPDYKRE